MTECFICGKELADGEGFASGVNAECKATDNPKEMVVVCSEECKKSFEKRFSHGGRPLSHYSRITGYMQLVENWNKGKQQELKDRRRYSVSSI